MLRFIYEHYKAVEGHALVVYPQECCGLILGALGGELGRQAMEIWPVTNVWTPALEAEYQEILNVRRDGNLGSQAFVSTRAAIAPTQNHSRLDRFSIAPRDLFQAQKYARRQGWQIIGIYHSHPDHGAEPSECDRQSAWPQYSYLILSVQQGRVTDCKSWRLNDQSQFEPEPWRL